MNRKGVLGLDTVKAVILALLVLAVLTIVVFAILVPLKTSVEAIDNQNGVVSVNETLTPFTEVTPYYFAVVNTARNPVCTLTRCTNATGVSTIVGINAANYTVDSNACSIVTKPVPGYYNNTVGWRCTYTYTYDLNGTNSVTEMMLVGPSSFFQNVPTFFVLLGVVVLILIISIVIVAVSRFSGGIGGGGGGSSAGSLENI